jgi:aminoglycoside phosphotransferase
VLLDGDRFHFLDVGEARIGDRSVDKVAAIWSLRHNYGRGSLATLLNGYGPRTPYRRKLAAYRQWWNSL